MARMPIPEDERQAIRIIGAFDAARASATFLRGMTSALLVKICEQRLWRLDGFSSQAAFLEHHKIDRHELADLKEEMGVFGELLMTRMDVAGIPRKTRRVLTHVDRREMIEYKKQLEAAPDAEALHDLAADLYNRIAEAEKDKTAAVDNAKNWKDKAEAVAATQKDTEKKLHAAQKDNAAKDKFYGADADRWQLFSRAQDALAQYQRFIRQVGIKTDDAKHFKRSIDELRNSIDNIWRDFIDPPKGTASREDYRRILMKEKGFTAEQAEDILAELAFEEK